MRLARYSDKGEIKLGAVKGDGLVELGKRFPAASHDMIDLIRMWPEVGSAVSQLAADATPDESLAKVQLLAPVARPGKIRRRPVADPDRYGATNAYGEMSS